MEITKNAANKIVTESFICKEIIGIDPGKSGGIAKYNLITGKIECWKMPDDFDKLLDFFDYQMEICELPIVCIEKVQIWNSDSETPGKQFGIQKMLRQYAELLSAIKTKKIPYIEVPSVTWQSTLHLRMKGEDKPTRKRRYKDIAQDLYPVIKSTLHVSDAILIMHFLRVKLKSDSLWVLQHLKKPEKKVNLFKE